MPHWFEPKQRDEGSDLGYPPDWIDLPGVTDDFDVPAPSEKDAPHIGSSGPDALAFYAPFHFYGRYYWGIYIRDYGLAYLASKAKGSNRLTRADSWLLGAAYWFLWRHEYFHFQAEVAATQFEILSGEATSYQSVFYDPVAHALEEALANAHAYRRLHEHESGLLSMQQVQAFLGFAATWMKTQPPGYRDYDKYCRESADFNRGLSAMVDRLLHVSDVTGQTRVPRRDRLHPKSVRLFEGVEYSRVPVARVRDSRIPSIRFARYFPAESGIRVSVHTREHPPAHVHVEFLGRDEVKLRWPDLAPLKNERKLTTKELAKVESYVRRHGNEIAAKAQSIFG